MITQPEHTDNMVQITALCNNNYDAVLLFSYIDDIFSQIIVFCRSVFPKTNLIFCRSNINVIIVCKITLFCRCYDGVINNLYITLIIGLKMEIQESHVIEIKPEVDSSEDTKNNYEFKCAAEIMPENQNLINTEPDNQKDITAETHSPIEFLHHKIIPHIHSPTGILQNEIMSDIHSPIELLQNKPIPGIQRSIEIIPEQIGGAFMKEHFKKY